MLENIIVILRVLGLGLIVLGGFASLVSAIGFHRFKNFYLRLHALTVCTIWGSVYPLIGVSILSVTLHELGDYRWFMSGASLITAVILLMLAPAGSHAIARAVHKARVARVRPCVADLLDKDLCG